MKRNMKSGMQKLGYIIFAMLLTGCHGHKQETDTKVIPVKVQTVSLSTDTGNREYIGTIEEESSSSLSFQVPGYVERVLVTEGQKVNKGQLLAVLSKGSLESAYLAAQASLKQAEDAYKRLSLLHDNNSLPEIKYVEVQTSLEQARSLEQIAKKNLDDCNLYAPFSGIIAKRSIDEGTNVLPGTPAFKVVKINAVKAKIAVPENEIAALKVGQQAQVMVTAAGNATHEGRIDEKGILASPLSHTYEVRILLNNSQGELMPGMACKVWINNGEKQEGIVIPLHAVQIAPNETRYVWLVDTDHKATRRNVVIGGFSKEGVIVAQGLTPGDRVIVEGYQRASEGSAIVEK
ncbi:MAG: efflux RND transporter periplasmic adaptor subunit [Candidatus Symbiothrix sp.]|nr:efflux RND transporter periplasmic adaptor subunit [Candidatus Symbiothrix sp.]